MQKYIIVKADTNDGDYTTKKTKITDTQIESLKPILEVIKTKDSNWASRDQGDIRSIYSEDELSNSQIDMMNLLIEHQEYGVHTIESVEILEVANEYRLL